MTTSQTLDRTIPVIIGLFIVFAGITLVFGVPADPNATVTLIQPDQSTVTVRPIGDERTGRLVTEDGYTVVRGDDGVYYFARQDTRGALTASSVKATNVADRGAAADQFLSQTAKGLAPSGDSPRPDPIAISRSAHTALTKRAESTTNNVLLLLIQFPDDAGTYPPSSFDALINEPGYDVYGSMNDFYQEVSYGQFGVIGTTSGWYTASNPRDYYGYNDGDNWVAAAELVREAVLAAEAAGVDFAPYDNDNNGEVDGLFVVHAGPGAEVGASEYPWSHKWGIEWAGLEPVIADGKTINSYTMEPEKYNSTEFVRIGVFCHEYGHEIGLPDLYDTDGSSIGVGRWCLMSGGSWNGPSGGGGKAPSLLSAWCKAQLGWVNPINVTENMTDELIVDVETNPIIYRLWKEGAVGNEYYLVENRQQLGFDTFIPGCGIAIWHIDDNQFSNEDETHRLVDLEEMDNSENSSAMDLWMGSIFAGKTVPSSDDYSGQPTLVEITVSSSSCLAEGLTTDLVVGVEPSCCVGATGDVNKDGNGAIDISDLTLLVNHLFVTFEALPCPEEANTTGDLEGDIDISDLSRLVNYLFVTFEATSACL